MSDRRWDRGGSGRYSSIEPSKRNLWITLEVREMNTCSKASLFLSFGQMAVGAKVGVSVGGGVGGFRPSFPLDEVGDPALSQGGGLCHVVPDCLRNTCDRQSKRKEGVRKGIRLRESDTRKVCYHLGRTWRAQQTHGCPHFSTSLPAIFPTLESFQSPQISPVGKKEHFGPPPHSLGLLVDEWLKDRLLLSRLNLRPWCKTSMSFLLSSRHKSASQT